MTPDTPYRWSPEVERQFLALMQVGASSWLVAEQIGCSERTARTLIRRHRVGLPLYSGPLVGGAAPVAEAPRSGRKTGKWAERFAAMSEEERERLRCRALIHATAGRSLEFTAAAVKMPREVVAQWIEEWDGEPVEMPEERAMPKSKAVEWPAWARFEDDPRACRPEGIWRAPAIHSGHRSYVSNATAWICR